MDPVEYDIIIHLDDGLTKVEKSVGRDITRGTIKAIINNGYCFKDTQSSATKYYPPHRIQLIESNL